MYLRWVEHEPLNPRVIVLSPVLGGFSLRRPGGASGRDSTCQCRRHRHMGSIPGSERSPGKGMATHSNILAWKIPRTEEPGRLMCMGPQRVRHD